MPFCAAGKYAFPPLSHATMHAHKQADAITTYAFFSQGYVLPLLGHTSSAVIPLLVFAVAILWMALIIRRAPKKQQQEQEEGAWVRPLRNVPEMVSAVGLLFGTFNITNVLWLTSPHPITHHHVRLALTQVAQKVELMQLAVVWRRLWPWFRRMPHLEVDLEVEDEDPLEVCSRELHAPYNWSKGPLWRARLVPLTSSGPGQHRAALVFSVHHVISDGTTNLLIEKDLLQALNAAAMGCSPNLPSRYLAPALGSRSAAASRYWLPSLGFVLAAIRAAFTTAFSARSALKHLPQPGAVRPLTKILMHEFSAEETRQLLAHFRAAGLRVHSCVTAVAGLALHRTAQQFASLRLGPMQVIQEQAVNMRRYHPQHSEGLGSMAFLTTQQHSVSDGSDTFWPLAHEIQDKLDRSLEVTCAPLRTGSMGWLCSAIIPMNLVLARLGCTSFSYSHICTSNMGDLRRIFGENAGGGDGRPVQLSGLLRTAACELVGNLCSINFQTLEGRLTLSLDYYTNKMTDEAGQTYFTQLIHVLTELAVRGVPPPSTTHRPGDAND
ncbi:hypothetical protein E2C01_041169 [Portunus trituberculatus]|uniref:Diacylglycerol O-acyltransferase n=2 Tax=Portunus trituberculatus TaxID=210409 RepID=A0A5B7FST3_PORTR|nr:hypothetical protein [Portunus trituberculatus]